MGEANGPREPLDHGRCEHDRALDDLCASVYLLKRWGESPDDSLLRFASQVGPRPVPAEDLATQLEALNDLARRMLDR